MYQLCNYFPAIIISNDNDNDKWQASASSAGLHQRTQSNPVPVRSDFTPVPIIVSLNIILLEFL